MKPGDGSVGDAIGGQSVQEYGVGDCIKGCTEIEQEEGGEGARVIREEEIIGDFDEGSFGSMEGTEARLKFFI